MAVACGMADVVACITAISFTRELSILGGPGDPEGMREQGATHAENPVYGLTSPAVGAAFALQRYMALYGATSADVAAVPVAFRKHALLSPYTVMKKPLTVDDHQASRMIVDPLHLFDCSLITDGAAVVLLASAERARSMPRPPVYVSGMQGTRSGRDEFIFAPPGLGINQQPSGQQPAGAATPRERDLAVYGRARDRAGGRAWVLHVRRLLAAGAVRAGALRLLRRRGSGGLGAGGPDRAGRGAAGQHLGRAAVGGARVWVEFYLRDGAAVARGGRAAANPRRRAPAMGHVLG